MGETPSSFLFRADLRTRFAGGVIGETVKDDEAQRSLNLEMECEMSLQREMGRVEVRSEEGLIKVLIKFLMADFEDLKGNLVAEERNSSAEVCSDDQSLFSILIF